MIFASLVAAVLIACGTAGDNGDGAGNGTDGTEESPPAEGEASSTGRDGHFEFTVDNMECGVPEIGDDFTAETAQGEYCLVSITVENIGDEARTLDVFSQTARDSEDREYEADDSLAAAIEYDEVWYNTINPGNTVEGILVYDVPDGTDLVELELHDAALSDGVTVSIP
jgi:hypothetical protein